MASYPPSDESIAVLPPGDEVPLSRVDEPTLVMRTPG